MRYRHCRTASETPLGDFFRNLLGEAALAAHAESGLRANPLLVAGGLTAVLIAVIAVFAPLLAPFPADAGFIWGRSPSRPRKKSAFAKNDHEMGSKGKIRSC